MNFLRPTIREDLEVNNAEDENEDGIAEFELDFVRLWLRENAAE